MRTTLEIEDDVLQAARERARYERKTIGEVSMRPRVGPHARSLKTAACASCQARVTRIHFRFRLSLGAYRRPAQWMSTSSGLTSGACLIPVPSIQHASTGRGTSRIYI